MEKTLREKIIDMYDRFSAREKIVAKYVVDNYREILALSSGELARATGVSDATVVRFAKTLGYKGFLQFRADLKQETGPVRSPYYISQKMNAKIDDRSISRYFETMDADARAFIDGLQMDMLEKLSENILKAQRVYLCGFGSDRIVADYLNNYFPLMGIPVTVLCEEGLALREKVLEMGSGDFVIMSSYPTLQDDEYWLYSYARECGAGIFLITDSDLTAKSLGAEDYVKTRSSMETFYNSSVLSMYFCDILLMKLREAAPERAEKYLKKYDTITNKKDR